MDEPTPRVPKTRVCQHCRKRRPRELFYRNATRGTGLRPECKPCTHARRTPSKPAEEAGS